MMFVNHTALRYVCEHVHLCSPITLRSLKHLCTWCKVAAVSELSTTMEKSFQENPEIILHPSFYNVSALTVKQQTPLVLQPLLYCITENYIFDRPKSPATLSLIK